MLPFALKFVLPIINKTVVEPLSSVKPKTSPQESFARTFASELHALSIVPCAASAKSTQDTSVSDITSVMQPSFSQLFPNMPLPLSSSEGESKKSIPGIVNFPISPTSTSTSSLKVQDHEKSSSIDIASILNFTKSTTQPAKSFTSEDAEASIGGNPSIVVSMRSESSDNDWARSHMETLPKNQKSDLLASGIMVACRIAI